MVKRNTYQINEPTIKVSTLLLTAVSTGIVCGLTHIYILFPLAWIYFVALLYVIRKYNLGYVKSFLIGLLAAFIQGIIVFSWIGKMSSHYSGNQFDLGYILSILMALVFAVKSAIPFLVFSYLHNQKKESTIFNTIILVVGTASSVVIVDYIFSLVFIDVPWLFHFYGYTQTTNLYFSQLAQFGGVWIMTFTVVVLNILFVLALINKNKKPALLAFSIIASVHVYGIVRVATYNEGLCKPISVALICDNTKPEIRWNQQYINSYVNTLFDLNKSAVATHSNLIIWNEGVIPWTFRNDDDFLKEILKQTGSEPCFELMSYFTNSEKDSSSIYNSAYLFNNKGTILGRYDKHKLLGGLEKPLWNINSLQLPFLNSSLGGKELEGNGLPLIMTKTLGNFGMLLCNESLTDIQSSQVASNGAGFIVSMANDNWFANTYLIAMHFYSTRLRAIEVRKPIVVNANMGYSGFINAKGEIEQISKTDDPKIMTANIIPNNANSNFSIYKTIFLLASLIMLILSLILKQ